ncbi:MAG: ribonuclease R [Bacteroidetes bacterium]|nr:ribonuclease R [Bacteroidota bacterium]
MTKGKKQHRQGPNLQYRGKISIVRNGMGFVAVEGMERDILIHAENLGNALDGDEVRVRIIKAGKKRIEGSVDEVLHRKQTEFSGRVEVKEHFAFLIPDKPNMTVDIFIPLPLLHGAADGDYALARITDWSSKKKNPIGEISMVLTEANRNDVAMQGILKDAGFPLQFPEEVLEAAARFPDTTEPDELRRRRDMRPVLTLTIDPKDARDFDDAISIQKSEGGYWELGVHIADVSHFVQQDSALDREAYQRATSVYLPDRVLPMLPEHLSNFLCSLRPNEEKYAFSAIFQINTQGKVKDYWLGRTVIRSDRRFTYEEVQNIIEGAEGDHREELLLLHGISQHLRHQRMKKGAINFSSQEVRFSLDEHGKPIGVEVKESKEANQLIEELMLLANRSVAHHVAQVEIKGKPIPFPYRVHDVPDEAKLEAFAAFSARYGHRLNLNSPEQIAHSFNEMLAAVHGKPEQHVLESLGIRTMAKAIYTTQNIGHYGLGFQDYCHFTSPIRRYPDVLVHRVLQEVLDGNVKPQKNMEQMCRHCSDMERAAMDAERAGNKYKQVEYMQGFIGEDFEAIISGVASFGFWAETVAHKCEGLVGMQELASIDNFLYFENEHCLAGRGTGIRFQIGDKLRIRVLAANLDKRQIDFGLAELPQSKGRSRQRKKQEPEWEQMPRKDKPGKAKGKRKHHG